VDVTEGWVWVWVFAAGDVLSLAGVCWATAGIASSAAKGRAKSNSFFIGRFLRFIGGDVGAAHHLGGRKEKSLRRTFTLT
jgi:hypothetical protein